MAEFIVGAGSTCDLPPEYVKKRDLKMLYYRFFMDGKEYIDNGASISGKDFYAKLSAGSMPSTSMISTEGYEAFFRSFLEAGKDVLYIEFSSGLSGTYNNARLTAQRLRAEFPERKLYVVDSLCASGGYGLLMHYILNKRDEGADIDSLYDWAMKNRLRVIHWFAVDGLDHLRRSGRVSRASAFFGTMLNIKPVLKFDDEGKIVPIEKVRGRRRSIIELADKMNDQFTEPQDATVFIEHANSPDDAEFLEKLVWERFPMIKETLVFLTGPVIGTHSGPGTINIHYLGNKR